MPPGRPHHPLQQEAVGEPLQKVTLDILGFDRPTSSGNRYVLVVIDALTKWAEAFPMQNEKAETVAKLLVEEFVCRVGIPAQLHSDQGRQFEAAVFQEMCRLLGIRKTRTTPLHPQSDGQSERFNRTLLSLLSKTAAENPAEWDQKLPYVMAAYRSTPHTTTGTTPNRLMMGRDVTTPLQLLAPPPNPISERTPWVDNLAENFEQAHQLVQVHYRKAQKTQKASYDKKQKGYSFEPGMKVWLWNPRPRPKTPYKLNPNRWDGPWEIVKRIAATVYHIKKQNQSRVVSVQRLAPYVTRPEELRPPRVQEEDEAEETSEQTTGISKEVEMNEVRRE
jgi:hypothetical protein